MDVRIVTLPGDGVGPEVVGAAAEVLTAVAERCGHRFVLEEALIGGAAIDEVGTPLPPETVACCRAADAALLGAIGGPKWDDPTATVRPERACSACARNWGCSRICGRCA